MLPATNSNITNPAMNCLDTNKLLANYFNQIKFPFGMANISYPDICKSEANEKKMNANQIGKEVLDLSLPNRSRINEPQVLKPESRAISKKSQPTSPISSGCDEETQEFNVVNLIKRKIVNEEEINSTKKTKHSNLNGKTSQKQDLPIPLLKKSLKQKREQPEPIVDSTNSSSYLNAAYFLQMANKSKPVPNNAYNPFAPPAVNNFPTFPSAFNQPPSIPFDPAASLAFLNQLFVNYQSNSFFAHHQNSKDSAILMNSRNSSMDNNASSSNPLQITTFATNSGI